MDYSLITHTLEDSVTVNGRVYRLDTRTTKALQAFAITEEDDETIPEEVRISKVISIMLDHQSSFLLARHTADTMDVYRGIAAFLKGWPQDGKKKESEKEPVFSFSEDHALIVAGFRQAYGISLAELKTMHWWEFRALLMGMPEETVLSSTMRIRAMDIDPKEPPKVKAAKRKAKEAVALKRTGGRAKTGEEIISDAFKGL